MVAMASTATLKILVDHNLEGPGKHCVSAARPAFVRVEKQPLQATLLLAAGKIANLRTSEKPTIHPTASSNKRTESVQQEVMLAKDEPSKKKADQFSRHMLFVPCAPKTYIIMFDCWKEGQNDIIFVTGESITANPEFASMTVLKKKLKKETFSHLHATIKRNKSSCL